ncbi:hypothetical protein SAMN04324258_3732 [Krasilnikoviella flava]|uniref:Uncharacterized protein n=2 Tax=Krasilnikoviella flava TaxID=526729 RepID=A0A1T5LQB5_9MICO|nr:hypothetical protein SAMN04324258_3732 [Krasilnikoviella flava]
MRTAPGPLRPPALPSPVTSGLLLDLEQAANLSGVLRLRGDLYTTPDPEAPPAVARGDLVMARVAATLAALDTQFWFSGPTAALVHGLWTYRLADAVHLTQLYPPQVRRETESWDHRHKVTRHWTDLPWRDRVVVQGVPASAWCD